MTMTELTRIVVCASCGCINHHLGKWKGGTWSELNRTKVYSISKKLNSAKVGNPLYLNSSHVVRAKPLQVSTPYRRLDLTGVIRHASGGYPVPENLVSTRGPEPARIDRLPTLSPAPNDSRSVSYTQTAKPQSKVSTHPTNSRG